MTYTWTFEVDWDDDTSYTDESGNMVDFRSYRGRQNYISPFSDGIQQFGVGQAVVTLKNFNKRYDSWNTASPIYPDCIPGKFARVKVTEGATTYNVFYGTIQDIRQTGGRSEPRVVITLADGWNWLRDRNSKTTLYTGVTTDVAIGHILDDVDWPSTWGRTLATGVETIPYWWANGNAAHNQITELANSELGLFYVANDGEANYKTRHTIETPLWTITQSDVHQELILPQPWDNLRNIVTVKYTPRLAQATQVIWDFSGTQFVGGGDSITLWAEHLYNYEACPAENVVTPVATTDYTMNSNSDGTGADITANFTVTPTKFAGTTKLVIANTGGAGGYITKLQLRGDPVATSDVKSVAEKHDYATKPHELTIKMEWLQEAGVAADFADYLADTLGQAQPFPIVQPVNDFAHQFQPDISNTITFQSTYFTINDDFRVGGIEHQWTDNNGQAVQTVLYLELYDDPSGYWQLNVSDFTESYLGY